MSNLTDRRSPLPIDRLLIVVILGITAVAVGLGAFSVPMNADYGKLIRNLSEFRIDRLRFFQASGSPCDPACYRKALTDAELFILSSRDSVATRRLRALMAVGSHRLTDAADILEELSNEKRDDPEVLNDLGVVYWGLGKENASQYFKALKAFERSARLSPHAAPRFNAAVAFRKVRIYDLADTASKEYQRSERSPFWSGELTIESSDDARLIDDLRGRLEAEDLAGAQSLLKLNPDPFRRVAIEYALNPPETGASWRAAEFVLDYFADVRGDETVRAILAPVGTKFETRIFSARRLVHRGVAAYLKSSFSESLHFYDLAGDAAIGTGSLFDELWIKLKRADSRLRSARTDPVGRQLDIGATARLLDEVIAASRQHKFDWLLGQALASKATASMTTRNQDEILPVLKESADLLTAVSASQDAARPLYYIALIHSMAGDFETSLSMAYRSLSQTQPSDNVRLAQLYWLSSAQLYRLGFEQYAMSLQRQAIDESVAGGNYSLVASNATSLAMIHVGHGEYDAADRYLRQTRMAREHIEAPVEQEIADVGLNLLCGQLSIATARLNDAEGCLNRVVSILRLQPKPAPELFAQALLQLAQVHTRRNEFDVAREELKQATDIIEQNDEYLATAALRTPFENQRRNLYDVAVAFEYDHDGKDAAWSYIQRYRAKLFLEFMRQMHPGLVLNQAIDRAKVQELIPTDVQVVEYVMLKDRLLIWLVSREKFLSATVPITRADLEGRVVDFVRHINNKGDVRRECENLYELLIEPIESELDPKRALAIIPDQGLHRLNFPALFSAAKRTFLIQQYTMLESPNLTTLLSGSLGTPSRQPAISFGARTDNTGATRELRALGQFYNDARSFNGDTAVKPAFLSSLGTASVFHYAGHSQDAADPLRSSILLDGDREGPNSVTAVDISRRKMPPNSVVVLASCDSSVGNSRDGIGMRGLTSAFLISGAGSVVGSLWLVEAESTSQLVLRFHENFAGNRIPVAAALRDAQLASINEGVHPYYWSGFVVTGNTSALR